MKEKPIKKRMRFSSLITSCGMTVPQAAEYLGTTPSIISNMMNGRTKVSTGYMEKLEDAFARVEAYVLFPKITPHPGERFMKAVRRRTIEMDVVRVIL